MEPGGGQPFSPASGAPSGHSEPSGMQSGLRGAWWDHDSAALNRAGHPKALEMLFTRIIIHFLWFVFWCLVFSSCLVYDYNLCWWQLSALTLTCTVN